MIEEKKDIPDKWWVIGRRNGELTTKKGQPISCAEPATKRLGKTASIPEKPKESSDKTLLSY
jgi:hypothetical protein